MGGVFPPGSLLEEELVVGGERLRLLRPSDPAALLDEEAFGADEFLPYWAELWPSARALCAALPLQLAGRRVLELGCGLALPSLLAARKGALVLAVDWAADALELLAENARRNGVSVHGLTADWRRPDELVPCGPFDLVLGSDLLYETRNVAPLLEVLEALATVSLIADPGRRPADEFFARATAAFLVEDLGDGVRRLLPR